MAEKDGSTMTAEERLARAWELFKEVRERDRAAGSTLVAIGVVLQGATKDPQAVVAKDLAEMGAEWASEWAAMYALEDMLRPEGVAA